MLAWMSLRIASRMRRDPAGRATADYRRACPGAFVSMGRLARRSRARGSARSRSRWSSWPRAPSGCSRRASRFRAGGGRERTTSSPPRSSGRDEYRGGQRVLVFVGLGAQGVVLVALALGRPRFGAQAARAPRRAPGPRRRRGRRRPLADDHARRPAVRHRRPRAVGRRTGSRPSRSGHGSATSARATAIDAVLAGAGAALLLALVRRFRRGWWVPRQRAVVALRGLLLAGAGRAGAAVQQLRAPAGGKLARAEVLELGARGGVDIGEVYAVDASRRSTALNAYVGGLGSTKRVVLYDNLIDRVSGPSCARWWPTSSGMSRTTTSCAGSPSSRSSRRSDCCSCARRPRARPQRRRRSGLAGVAARLRIVIAVVSFVLNIPGNQLSRDVEAAADDFALELTDDPQGLIDLQRRLAARTFPIRTRRATFHCCSAPTPAPSTGSVRRRPTRRGSSD